KRDLAVGDPDREIIGAACAALRHDGETPRTVVTSAGGRDVEGRHGHDKCESAGASDFSDHDQSPDNWLAAARAAYRLCRWSGKKGSCEKQRQQAQGGQRR